jgi:tetratricopeptide (TPR) repeat protein/2-polyprenyl-3-methyl-5-hydroxy-6-metoxy-1,4-benzoquinol methylase
MSVAARPLTTAELPSASLPSQAGGKAAQARVFLQRKNLVEAVNLAREAIALDGDCVDALLVMAELALNAGNTDLAQKMVTKAARLEPGSERIRQWQKAGYGAEKTFSVADRETKAGWVHHSRQEWSAAVDCGVRAVQADKHFVEAYHLLGVVCLQVGKVEEAVKMFRATTELEPKNAARWHHLGTALRKGGFFSAAVDAFRNAVKRDPNLLASMMALVDVLLLTGDASSAGEILEAVLAHQPGNQNALLWLGHVRKRQGRLTEALKLHRQSVGAVDGRPNRAKPRVVFVVQHGPMWTSLASVYAAFAADSAWETIIVGVPYLGTFCEGNHDKSLAVFEFLQKENLPFVRWDEFKLEPGCADILFLPKPHDHTRPVEWQSANLLKFVPRLAYVPYGLEIGGGEANADIQWNLPLQQLAWMIFARSERQKNHYAKHCLCGNAHVVVTGHPKMDAVRALDTARDADLERELAGRKMILWNPQYDVRPDGTEFGAGYSTFMRWWKFLPAEFARRPGLALVIRPHPIFFAIFRQRNILTEEQIEQFFAECAAAGNIFIDRRSSYLPAFAASAAMISDASSFLLEYSATGRPLLYLRNPRGPGLNADGEFFTDHGHCAETDAEMRAFLDLVESGVDPKADQRRAAYPQFMHVPKEGVGRSIKRAIEKRLADETATARDSVARSSGQSFWANCTNTHLAPSDYYEKAKVALQERVLKHVKPKHRVVDFGCGNGEMTLLTAPYCREAIGYDLSPALVVQARIAAAKGKVANATFEVLDLVSGCPEKPADVVLCLGVFSCIDDDVAWLATLERFARMLPPNGLLVLRDTVSCGPRQEVKYGNGYHACYRGRDEYLAAVQARGFARIDETQLFGETNGTENYLWIFRRTPSVATAPAA